MNPQPSTLSQQLLQLPSIPDHELIRCVGRGAYGEVWLAQHARLGSLRAVKIIRRDQFDHDRPFQREFDGIRRYEPISRGHPNLVAILHVGGTDACFFYVMELADDAVTADVRRLTSPGARVSPSAAASEAQKGSENSQRSTPGGSAAAGDSRAPDRGSPDPQHARMENGSVESDRARTFVAAAAGDSRAPQSEPPHVGCYEPKTLRSELKHHGALPIDRCLEIGRALAGALAHLHARGLVHRDVKPSNVIFVEGVAKLADIGLVAAVSDSRSYVGTEGYIPPEGPGAPSADCYALGKLLYELSTGHDRTAWPEPPAGLPTRPDRERLLELNAILHRACAPQPSERYRDAEAMLADLERLIRGKSVRRMHRVERHWYSVRRVALWLLVGTGALALLLLAARLGQPPTNVDAHKRSTNAVANDHYDIGNQAYVKNRTPDLRKAMEHFRAAVEADPNFGKAQAMLAATYCWGGAGTNRFFEFLPQAREIAERALALDESLAKAHLALAWHAFMAEWDWPKAEQHFKRACALESADFECHAWYGLYLRAMGRVDEAVREMEAGCRLNPESVSANRFLSFALLTANRHEEALRYARKAVELSEPEDRSSVWTLVEALRLNGKFEEAITMEEELAVIAGTDRVKAHRSSQELLAVFRAEGQRGYWQKQLERTLPRATQPTATRTSEATDLASLHARTGNLDQALHWLEIARERREYYLVWQIKTDPTFDPIRSHPRYVQLLRRMKMAD